MKRLVVILFAFALLPLTTFGQTNTFPADGPVGVGTTSPSGKMTVFANQGDTYFRTDKVWGWSRIFVDNDQSGGFYMQAYGSQVAGTSSWGLPFAGLSLLLGTSASNGIVMGSNGPFPLVLSTFHQDRLRIDSTGRVGIGTSTPAYLLDVAGTLHVTGNATFDGNIAAKYQDLAEWVPATSDIEPGTVVVLDRSNANHVVPSSYEYDTAVAGVVSAQPGMILGEASDSKEMVATTGRVRVRVDATSAPIAIGDLLVSSPKPGTAMKSQPVSVGGVEMHRPGTLIGKALEPLADGEGEILVLLSLQ